LRALKYTNNAAPSATASLGTRAVSVSAGQAMPNCRSNGLVLAVSILDAPVADSPAPTPESLGGASSLSQTPFPPFNLLPLGSSITSGAGAAVVTVTAAAAFVAVMAALAL